MLCDVTVVSERKEHPAIALGAGRGYSGGGK